MTALKIVRAGLFDTVQDLGRIGFMALGMPTSGAMDRIALALANALVGNPAGAAGLEIGVMGPDLLVEADSVRAALIASVDLPRLGRLLPGRTVRFTAITVEEAEKLRREQEARLARAIADLPMARPPGGIDLARLYEENLISGIIYEASR